MRAMRLARMIQAVDAHAAGEPGRVIVGGVLDVPGTTILEKMRHLEAGCPPAFSPRADRELPKEMRARCRIHGEARGRSR